MLERLGKITKRVTPTESVKVVDDPDDNKIIECAVAARSEFIVTNDKALLRVREYKGVRILNLAGFLEHRESKFE